MKWILVVIVFFLCLATEVRADNVALSWQRNSTNEDGFNIEMSLNKSAFVKVGQTGANVVTYVEVVPRDPMIDNEACFRVAAFNTTGQSGYSNTACATLKRQLPSDPSNLIIQLQEALQGILNYRQAR